MLETDQHSLLSNLSQSVQRQKKIVPSLTKYGFFPSQEIQFLRLYLLFKFVSTRDRDNRL